MRSSRKPRSGSRAAETPVSPLVVAIVGRPNVGKSTLFNRLVGRRLALVADEPGVTRDRREGPAKIADLRFTVIDTAGLVDGPKASLEARLRRQTERGMESAHVALFLVDGRTGVTPLDRHFVAWLRRQDRPVIVVVNKCEGTAGRGGVLDATEFGFGDPVPMSAEHGEGLDDLYQALRPFVDAQAAAVAAEVATDAPDNQRLSLVIVGRPNTGKSTLVNRLLGEERMLTGPEPGLTRDSIAVSWIDHGQAVRLVDTAGLRRKAKVTEKIETMAQSETLRAIRLTQAAVLLLDATVGVEHQDLAIGSLIVEEGRVLIVALNKWDLVDNGQQVLDQVRTSLSQSLSQARGVPIVTISALTGRGVEKLMPAVQKAVKVWSHRVPTSALNRWLEEASDRNPPPLVSGRTPKIRYVVQVSTRPPTFVAFLSRPEGLPAGYIRYLTNSLRDAFDLDGVPIRFELRKSRNPFKPG